MHLPTFTGVLTALAVVLLAARASATEQVRDVLTFEGRQGRILERPFNTFLERLPRIPRFNISSSANWKGYTASWVVKDSRLYLATFHATTNGQPYSISSLSPDRELPICAAWYSGTVHIVNGRKTLAQGRYTYERVTALQVTNGVVVATNLMANVSEDRSKR